MDIYVPMFNFQYDIIFRKDIASDMLVYYLSFLFYAG